MPDLNTDPKLMRSQQDADTPESIPASERDARLESRDSDSASRADREAAKRGEAHYEKEQMQAILAENGGTRKAPDEVASSSTGDREKAEREGLAGKGRSKLR